MRRNPTKLIEAWFAEHCDDGDFVYEGRAAPYTVIGPAGESGSVVYAPKPAHAAPAIYESSDCAAIGLIGRYGLPCDDDIAWIRQVVAGHRLCFLGDLDPADLMIFAWLRARLRPKRIEHLGINDGYLAGLGVALPESFTIKYSVCERQSLPALMAALPDLLNLVGPKCARLVKQERKVEIDAVVSALGTAVPLLQSVATQARPH